MHIANFEEYKTYQHYFSADVENNQAERDKVADYFERRRARLKKDYSAAVKVMEDFSVTLNENKAALFVPFEALKDLYKNKANTDEKQRLIAEYQALLAERSKIITARTDAINRLYSFERAPKEDKKYVCIYYAFKKLLTAKICEESNPCGFAKDAKGDVIFDVEKFEQSYLGKVMFGLRDYITVYVDNYDHEIPGRSYFADVFQDVKTDAILPMLDDFMKSHQYNEAEIARSKDGTQVLMRFPEKKLQIVRLLNSDAIKYEGSAMHHCLGDENQPYLQQNENGEMLFFSLRKVQRNMPSIPHATIIYNPKTDEVEQIRGKGDKNLSLRYVKKTREFLREFLDEDDLANTSKIRENQKICLGYVRDADGDMIDLFGDLREVTIPDLGIDGSDIPYIHEIKAIHELNVLRTLTARDIEQAQKIDIHNLYLHNINNLPAIADFSGYDTVKEFGLYGVMAFDTKQIKLPKNIEKFVSYSFFENITASNATKKFVPHHWNVDLQKHKKLKSVVLDISEPIKLPASLEEIDDLGLNFNVDFSRYKNLKKVSAHEIDFDKLPEKIQSVKTQRWKGGDADFTRFTELKTLKLGQNAEAITSLKLPIHIKDLEFRGSSFDSSFGEVLDLSCFPELEEIKINLSGYKENPIKEIKLPVNIKKVEIGYGTKIEKIDMRAVKNKSGVVIEGADNAEKLFDYKLAQRAINSREM